MVFTMSYNEAIEIQRGHIAYYHRGGNGPLTERGIDNIKAMTKPCPFDPDEQRSVIEINRLVPRGHDIEMIMGISPDIND